MGLRPLTKRVEGKATVGREGRRGHVYVLAPKGVFFSLLIIGVGVIFLLDQMNIVSAHYVFSYFWPAIFIFLGLDSLVFNRCAGRTGGVFLTVVGTVLLLGNLGYLHFRWTIIWPFILIYWGLWMLIKSLRHNLGKQNEPEGWKAHVNEWVASFPKREKDADESGDDTFRLEATFSTVKRRITSKNFKGGKMEAVFGEVEVDLRDAEIEGEEAVLKAEAVFGTGKIFVPNTWVIQSYGSPVFGEFTDQTHQRPPEGTGAKRLIIKGGAVFGSITVRN
jgi:predicted membrane protein